MEFKFELNTTDETQEEKECLVTKEDFDELEEAYQVLLKAVGKVAARRKVNPWTILDGFLNASMKESKAKQKEAERLQKQLMEAIGDNPELMKLFGHIAESQLKELREKMQET